MKYNKEFVPYSIAKHLKEVGFNLPCIARWEKENFVMNHLANYYNHNKGEIKQGWISAPTWWQVKKWLKDEKQIIVLPNASWSEREGYVVTYDCYVYLLEEEGTKLAEAVVEEFDFATEEDALEAGIKATLDYYFKIELNEV